jgi:hypothetical protein
VTGEEPRPIFVVGCQRSGTTLLRLMIDSHPNISCGPETRFLKDFSEITGKNWERLALYGFPKEYWFEKVADLFDTFQSDYAAARGKKRWADKTPLYALSLPYIVDIFPTCQIIHVIRDGRAVVASHRDRFGYISAVKATEKWGRYIHAARQVGTTLPADRYLEVRYEDLISDTEGTLRTLLNFLGEPWDPAVLDYDASPHDVMPHYATFTRARRQSANGPGAVYTNRMASWKRELDPLLLLLIRWRGGATLRELGYR